MRKLLFIGVLLAVLVMTPITVSADDCCDYEAGCCCWERCCAERTAWYMVSYSERVSSGYFFQGVEMTTSVWTHQLVEAHDYAEAADLLGLRAGYNCFVSRVIPKR